LVGGLEKKINPFLGGLFTAMIYVWFTSLGQDVLGTWLTENLYLVPLALLLVSVPLFPRGLVGSFRRVVEHGY
jgi:ABC-type branched-subunit amino acid transport system permease subunit